MLADRLIALALPAAGIALSTVATIAEIRAIMGDAHDQLVEGRSGRFRLCDLSYSEDTIGERVVETAATPVGRR